MDDVEIITRIQGGEIDLYRFIVEKYEQKIRSFVTGKLFEKLNIDDIVQTTFIKFYQALDSFDRTKPVTPYLYAIAHNELKMYYRSHRKDVVRLENVSNEPFIHVDETDRFTDDELERLLKDLNSDQRRALTLFASGYKYHEIAQMLQKPVNTVRTLIRRARLTIIHKKNEQS